MATYNGSNGDDTLSGVIDYDQYNLGEGNNNVKDLIGSNMFNAGAGNDSIQSGTGNDTFNLGEGNNTVTDAGGNNTVNTGSGADNITTGDGNDQINAGGGNNTINAGGGSNRVNTGSGADNITSGSGDDEINAGEGNNTIDAGGGRNRVTAGAGADHITTGDGDDDIYAGEGNNTIHAGGGVNHIYTGSGTDTIVVGTGNSQIFSGGGADDVRIGGGAALLYAGEGNDTVHITKATAGSMDLWGEGGSDTLEITLTKAEALNQNVRNDLDGFKASLGKDWMYTFKTMSVTARQFENLKIVAPVDSHADYAQTDEDHSVKIDVLANDQDLLAPDNSALKVTAVTNPAEGGTVTINPDKTVTFNPGSAYQHLAAGQHQDVTFSYTVADDQGFSENQTVTVRVNGVNDIASISGNSTGSVTEDGSLTSSGKLTVSDVDDGENHFQIPSAQDLKTEYGSFTFDANGNWTFTLDNTKAQSLNAGDHIDQKLVVTSADGTATREIHVTVNGADDRLPGSFENGDFDGWQTIGSASISTDKHTDGTHSLLLTGASANQNDIENFLGTSNLTLDLLSIDLIPWTGSATTGAAAKTTVHLEKGQTFHYEWYFDQTEDFLSENDFAFVRNPNGTFDKVASVYGTGDTGWNTVSFKANATGDYTFGIGAVNTGDNSQSPKLYIDHVYIA